MIDKIKKFLFEYDFLWSIPLGFILFVLFPVVGEMIWGEGFSGYPPVFFHAGIYAALMVMLFTSFIQMGIFFQFPEMYNYYLKNFNEIEPSWLKPIIFLWVFFVYFYFVVKVWQTLV